MLNFKVGDLVECFYDDSGDNKFVGKAGRVTSVNESYKTYPYHVDFGESTA